MRLLFSLRLPTRLIVALVAMCVVCAPFSANCCMKLACEPSNASQHSESPCHENLSAQAKVLVNCHGKRMTCADTLFELPLERSDEFVRTIAGMQKSNFALVAVPETSGVSSMSAIRAIARTSPDNPLAVTYCSLSPAPLKL